MAGSEQLRGGKLAGATNRARYGNDYYKRIGKIGGENGRTGGFYADRERASVAGKLGGAISRRGKKLNADDRLRLRAEYEKTYAHLLQIHESNKHKSVV